MDIIATGRLVLDGKEYSAGQKIATDDDTGADLIVKGKAKIKEDPKPKAPKVTDTPAEQKPA